MKKKLYLLILPFYILLLLVLVGVSCNEEEPKTIIKWRAEIEYRDTCISKPPIIKWKESKIETLYLPGITPQPVIEYRDTCINDTSIWGYELLIIKGEDTISSYNGYERDKYLASKKVYQHYSSLASWCDGARTHTELWEFDRWLDSLKKVFVDSLNNKEKE